MQKTSLLRKRADEVDDTWIGDRSSTDVAAEDIQSSMTEHKVHES